MKITGAVSYLYDGRTKPNFLLTGLAEKPKGGEFSDYPQRNDAHNLVERMQRDCVYTKIGTDRSAVIYAAQEGDVWNLFCIVPDEKGENVLHTTEGDVRYAAWYHVNHSPRNFTPKLMQVDLESSGWRWVVPFGGSKPKLERYQSGNIQSVWAPVDLVQKMLKKANLPFEIRKDQVFYIGPEGRIL